MNSQPPVASTWLLTRFGSAPDNDVLLGDLAEEYRRGRSTAWYWRQVVAAIASEFLQTARAHKILLIRALVIGWALTYVWFNYAGTYLYGRCAKVLLQLGYKPENWMDTYGYWLLLLAVGCIGAMLTGWIVGRLHRPYEMTMVLAYVAFAIVLSFPEIFRLISDSSGDYPRFLPYLRLALTRTALKALCALVGGLWSGIDDRTAGLHAEGA